MVTAETNFSRTGPLYLRTDTDGVVRGRWTEDSDGSTSLLDVDQILNRKVCAGDIGSTATNNGEPRVSLRSFPSNSGGSAPILVDPYQNGLLEWLDTVEQPHDRVLLDLRDVNDYSFTHTLPVRGWLQERAVEPAATYPRSATTGQTGEGPVFVLVHGFTGDPANWDLVRDRLSPGPWPYFIPLLPGHGRSWSGLSDVDYTDWEMSIRGVLNHFNKRSRRVVGIGLSMGGILLIQNHDLLDGLVTINSPWSLHDIRAHFLSVLKQFKRYHYSEEGGKVIPISAIHELHKLLKRARATAGRVDCPSLVLNHEPDDVVPVADGDRFASHMDDSTRRVFSVGGHESPTDHAAVDPLMDAIREWLRAHSFEVPRLSRL